MMHEYQEYTNYCIEIDPPMPNDGEYPASLSDLRKGFRSGRYAAIARDRMWNNGDEIRIRFLNGSDELRKEVKNYAVQWTQAANLTFNFIERGEADVRISFMSGGRSSSAIGIHCRDTFNDQSDPTMYLGIINLGDDMRRRVILHEFGHVIGLIHEQNSPTARVIPWDKDAVYEDFGVSPNKTKEENDRLKASANAQYLDPWNSPPEDVDASEYDGDSIMLYPIKSSWVTDESFARDFNTKLSDIDRRTASIFYPKYSSAIGNYETQNNWEDVNTGQTKNWQTYYNVPPADREVVVATGINMVDMGPGGSDGNLRITSEADKITLSSFELYVGTWATTILYNASVSYLMTARDNPLIQTGRCCFQNSSGAPLDQTSTEVIYFDKPFRVTPNVFVGFTRWDITGGNWRLQASTNTINHDHFHLEVRTWSNSRRYSDNTTWIAFPSDAEGMATGEFGTTDTEGNWSGSITFPKVFDRVPQIFTAFTTFDVDDDANFRCRIKTTNVTKTGMDWSIETWSHTYLYQIRAAYFAYVI